MSLEKDNKNFKKFAAISHRVKIYHFEKKSSKNPAKDGYLFATLRPRC
jgi:hypothetical protein